MPIFEWDEAKNRANKAKHNIWFEHAQAAFNGPMMALEDNRFSYDETRWIGTGFMDVTPIVVVFTTRGETIRIISARKATRHEREAFAAWLRKGGS